MTLRSDYAAKGFNDRQTHMMIWTQAIGIAALVILLIVAVYIIAYYMIAQKKYRQFYLTMFYSVALMSIIMNLIYFCTVQKEDSYWLKGYSFALGQASDINAGFSQVFCMADLFLSLDSLSCVNMHRDDQRKVIIQIKRKKYYLRVFSVIIVVISYIGSLYLCTKVYIHMQDNQDPSLYEKLLCIQNISRLVALFLVAISLLISILVLICRLRAELAGWSADVKQIMVNLNVILWIFLVTFTVRFGWDAGWQIAANLDKVDHPCKADLASLVSIEVASVLPLGVVMIGVHIRVWHNNEISAKRKRYNVDIDSTQDGWSSKDSQAVNEPLCDEKQTKSILNYQLSGTSDQKPKHHKQPSEGDKLHDIYRTQNSLQSSNDHMTPSNTQKERITVFTKGLSDSNREETYLMRDQFIDDSQYNYRQSKTSHKKQLRMLTEIGLFRDSSVQ